MDLARSRWDWLFILAAFLGSSLIFLVQPMVARELLPTLGGAPAVWTACMLFFQACLLVGYGWAHVGPRLLGDRIHAGVHILLLLSLAFFLPMSLWSEVTTGGSPALSVLRVLMISIGLPMCVLSATSPLLQRWHGAINPSRGDRVYRLYSIGNVASLLVLLAYPLLIEPTSTLRQQRIGWSIALCALAVLLIVAALLRLGRSTSGEVAEEEAQPTSRRFGWIWWVLLSAVPSSYLLGVTSYLTSDVAAVPFLWVLPLALYLGAFSIAFAGKTLPSFLRNALGPGLALICLVLIGAGWTTMSVPATVALHAGTFFLLTTSCLGELYQRRPARSQLTAFYLWIAVGGVIGGVFNSLLAPILFQTTAEYPFALLLCASMAIQWPRGDLADGRSRRLYVAMVLVMLIAATTYAAQETRLRFGFDASLVMLCMGVPIVLCYIVRKRPIAFALCTATMSGTMLALGVGGSDAIEIRRSFFGVHRVRMNEIGGKPFIELYHGTTLHGRQRFDPATNRPTDSEVPMTYYHPDGPLGQMILHQRPERLSVIGLGTGGIAGYVGKGQTLTYFEIDPVVIELANKPKYFSFLQDARDREAEVRIVEGDARLTLRQTPPGETDLLVLDAFSGDAIPVHLLTREAFEMYAERLTPSGTLVSHISNHYLDLRQVVANGAAAIGGTVLIRDESHQPEVERTSGRAATTWIAVTRDEHLAAKLRSIGWIDLKADGKTVWTDDYSNLLRVLK